jgi:hypothetical protein
MANIFAIFPGSLTFTDLCAMDVGELMKWHDRALKRSRSEK